MGDYAEKAVGKQTNIYLIYVKACERQKLPLDYFQLAARRERPSCLATRSEWG